MAGELYNPEKQYATSGKEVSTPVAEKSTEGAESSAEGGKEEGGEGEQTAEQIENARIAAQANMSEDEIKADNEKHAESLLTPEQKAEKQKVTDDADKATKEIQTKAEEAATKKLLDALGVKSLDELKGRIPAKELTPEEKAKQEQSLKANVAQYAVKNDMLSMDEITSLENMRKMTPQQLVYDNFAKEYREAHKERVGEDEKPVPVTEAEIEDSFNEFYHVNSENNALKKSGEKMLDQSAKSLMSGVEAKYNDAVADYQEYEARKTFFPTFKSFLDEVVATVPEELTFGEGDKKIVFKTGTLDKEAIKKLYTTDAAYDAFYQQKGEQKVRDVFKIEFNERLIAKNIQAILNTAVDVGIDIGTKKGSETGAKAPFDENKNKQQADNSQKVKITREEARKEQSKYYSGAER